MSWDIGSRCWIIKNIKKQKRNKIMDLLKPIKERNEDNFIIDLSKPNEIEIEEGGAYKYRMFSSRCKLNDEKLMKDIFEIDNDITIRIEEFDYNLNYYYENGKIRSETDTSKMINEDDSKEEIIEKVKKDFYYFEMLDENIRNDYDIQFASLEADYSTWTLEFGSDEEDKCYTDEFLDHEEVVRKIFECGNRFKLFKNRVKDKYKDNVKLMKELLPLQPWYIAGCNEMIKSDKKLVLELLEISNKNRKRFYIEDISTSLLDDKDIAIAFIKNYVNSIDKISNRLKSDYDVCKTYIINDGNSLQYVNNEKVLDDKELILTYINNSFSDCYYSKISDRLKEDNEVLASVISKKNIEKNQKRFYNYLIKLSKKDMILYEMKNDYRFFVQANYIIPKSVYYDKDFILQTIKFNKKRDKYDKYLIRINTSLLKDKDFMDLLKKSNSDYIIDIDENITKESIINNIDVINYFNLPDKYKNNKDIIFIYLNNNKDIFCRVILSSDNTKVDEINPKLLKDSNIKDLVFENINMNGLGPIKEITNEKKKVLDKYTDYNKKDLYHLLNNNGFLIDSYPKYYKDKEMVIKAIGSYPIAYTKINKELQNDIDVINALSKVEFISMMDYVSIEKALSNVEVYKNNKEVALKLVKSFKTVYKYLSEELKKDKEIIEESNYIDNLIYYPNEYQKNKKFVLSLLKPYDYKVDKIKEIYDNMTCKEIFDDEDFIKEICKDKNKDSFIGESNKPNIMFASSRIRNYIDFVSKLFNIDIKFDNVLDLYIYLLHNEEIVIEDLLENIKYYRNYCIINNFINSVDDYPECDSVEKLFIKLYKENNFDFNKRKLLTNYLIKNRSFIIGFLKDNKSFIDNTIDKSKDRILKYYSDDKEIMKLYDYDKKILKDYEVPF